jgi:hypothetical protein
MNLAEARALMDEVLDRAQQLRAFLVNEPAAPADSAGGVRLVRVRPGDDVAGAYADLQRSGGGILACRPGTYRVNLAGVPREPQAPLVTLTTDNATDLPAPGERTGRERAAGLAIFQSPSAAPTVRAQPRAANLAFVNVGFGPTPSVGSTLVELGGDRTTLKVARDQAQNVLFDRVLFYGESGRGQHRGLQPHARDVKVTGCAFYDFIEPGRDAQAIGGWNGGHGVVVENSLLEGGGENVLIGGGDAATPDLQPRDWLFRRCTIRKDLEWMNWPNYSKLTVKCLFETKNVDGLVIEGCLLENAMKKSWAHGPGLVLKCANQEGSNPWAHTSNVRIAHSVVRHVGQGINLVGYGDAGRPSARMAHIEIAQLLVYDFVPTWGNGCGLTAANPPDDLRLDHVTFDGNRHSFAYLWFDQGQPQGSALAWTNSVMSEGTYGAFSGQTGGVALLHGWAAVDFRGNVLARTPARKLTWPPGNLQVEEGDLRASMVDHQLATGLGTTTDGALAGADVAAILAQTGSLVL